MQHRSPWTWLGLLTALLLAPAGLRAADAIDPALAKTHEGDPALWYDLPLLDVEGKGWADTKAPYDRLPAKAEGSVRPPVWQLSRHSAGLCARFVTDATAIDARWTLTSDRLAMPHMPATGVSGLDLYVKADDGRWHWLGVGQPTAATNTAHLVTGIPAGRREYLLYLPLYNGVTSVELGLPKGTTLAKAPPRPAEARKPIVFYGTSITQGGCASRPGMVHTAILGRHLDRPVINLGFSGNGKMEPELAALLAELDPAAYVLDCLPNMNAAEVSERVEPFVRTLRKARPETPIVLVEDRSYANAFLVTGQRRHNEESRAALRAVYDRLVKDRVGGLHYLPGADLLGDDGEATVDSSHPTDLGFVRQADAFARVLGPVLRTARGDARTDPGRWEKEIAAFEQRDRDKPLPKNAVVFVGSSSIRLWDLSKSFPGIETINRGFGGSQLADSAHFAPRVVVKYEPRLVVLYAGDNDLAAGKTPEQVADDFRTFVRTVREGLPKVRIVFLSIKPSIQRWKLVDRGRRANDLIEAGCKQEEGLVYVDVGTPLLGEDGKPRRELFRDDGLHLNEKGYEVWASIVKPYLK
jgi:lysophospholipase L1-like esterase